jgi:hypothetical protein
MPQEKIYALGGEEAIKLCQSDSCASPGSCEFVEDGICVPDGDSDIFGSCVLPVTPIPTISEWGLIAMAGILGIVGFMVMRRRKVTA